MPHYEIENYMKELKDTPNLTETKKRLLEEMENLLKNQDEEDIMEIDPKILESIDLIETESDNTIEPELTEHEPDNPIEPDLAGIEPHNPDDNNDAKGFFIVELDETTMVDIIFKVISSNKAVPGELTELWHDAEYTNMIIKKLKDTDSGVKEGYVKELLKLSKVGLEGEFPKHELAKKALKLLKSEITLHEGGRIKNTYMTRLGIEALIVIVISVLIGCLFKFGVFSQAEGIKSISSYFFVLTGAMAGTWISFGVRKLEITFDDLAVIEKDRMKPWLRLLFVGLSSIILLLFINSSFITINVAGIDTNALKVNVELQLFLGIIAGLMERKLAKGLFSKAEGALDIEID